MNAAKGNEFEQVICLTLYDDNEKCYTWIPLKEPPAKIACPSSTIAAITADHYQRHLYYVPETSGYWVSGLANSFPQHCIAPKYTHLSHINIIIWIANNISNNGMRTLQVLPTLVHYLDLYVTGVPPPTVELDQTHPIIPIEDQRVIPFPSHAHQGIQRVSKAVPMPLAYNPTVPWVLRTKTRTHQQLTRGNIPTSVRNSTTPSFHLAPQANICSGIIDFSYQKIHIALQLHGVQTAFIWHQFREYATSDSSVKKQSITFS
jgi:hypothetical protein